MMQMFCLLFVNETGMFHSIVKDNVSVSLAKKIELK